MIIARQPMEKPESRAAPTASKPLTTFVHVDTDTFREVVQRLTGPSDTEPPPPAPNNEAAAGGKVNNNVGVRKPSFKLHERRQYVKPKLEIVKPQSGFLQYKSVGFQSPTTTFSKLSILEQENKGETTSLINEEEEKAIKERRFYLHPSPRSRPGYTEPELLTLFPLTSPKTKE